MQQEQTCPQSDQVESQSGELPLPPISFEIIAFSISKVLELNLTDDLTFVISKSTDMILGAFPEYDGENRSLVTRLVTMVLLHQVKQYNLMLAIAKGEANARLQQSDVEG